MKNIFVILFCFVKITLANIVKINTNGNFVDAYFNNLTIATINFNENIWSFNAKSASFCFGVTKIDIGHNNETPIEFPKRITNFGYFYPIGFSLPSFDSIVSMYI